MKKMTLVLLAALSMAAVGCKKKGGSGEATARQMAQFTELKDKLCACKGASACVNKVADELNKWHADPANLKESQMSDDERKRSTAIEEEVLKCTSIATTPAAGAAGSAEGS